MNDTATRTASIDSDALAQAQAEARDQASLAEVVELRPGTSLGPRTGAVPRLRRFLLALTGSQRGMATAEYAIATLAAVGFAGLLVVILRSEEVRGFLLNLVRTALSLP